MKIAEMIVSECSTPGEAVARARKQHVSHDLCMKITKFRFEDASILVERDLKVFALDPTSKESLYTYLYWLGDAANIWEQVEVNRLLKALGRRHRGFVPLENLLTR